MYESIRDLTKVKKLEEEYEFVIEGLKKTNNKILKEKKDLEM